jgi:Tol biopolymer transport system component/DNA-binding winged helix-turn-helix (wHTH) protein
VSEAPVPSRQVVRFGAFELDLRVGELRKAGVRVNLQEQPLKVLECLVERAGELVTREELRQRLWQGDTFVDFEHGVNAAVKRLRETLGDSAETPRFIETLPRRGYRLIAPVERDQPPVVVEATLATADCGDNQRLQAAAELPAHPKRWSDRLIGASVLGILVTAAFAGWVLSRSSKNPELPMKVVPLTSLTGFEIAAKVSADGTRVAFTWNGEAEDNFDIYVQMVGSAEPQRLSTDPAFEGNPNWSPNNMQIAYLRGNPQRELNVWVMSALGGPGQKISDLPVSLGISWSPDGRYITAAQSPPNNGIYLIPVQGGEPRASLRPTAQETVQIPSFSPDGRFLAYASCQGPGKCYVQIVEVDAAFVAHGASRQLTRHPAFRIEGITWSRDGQFVVYGAYKHPQNFSLWRAGVDSKRPEERIEIAGLNATAPTITLSGDLVFSRFFEDIDVYRLGPGLAVRPVAQSSNFDGNPQFSPDGLRFAFCSARSGDALEIWTAASDGSEAHRLTNSPGIWKCSPAWSPDSRQIAFDSQSEDGDWHIWRIDAGGGIPQPVTNGSGSQNAPTWSRDGHWIYFSWDQGSGRQIWRTHVQNGTREQITHGRAGWVGRESVDGQSIFYQLHTGDAALMAQPLTGGEPRKLIPCVSESQYSIAAEVIYYVPCQDSAHPDPNPPVHVLNPVTRKDHRHGRLEKFENVRGGLAVSPDGQTILYTRLVSRGADLMSIQNFR